jgi:hypothetical protein
MKTLGIAVQNNKVVAREVNDACTPIIGSTGDIEVDPQAQIRWMNCGDDWEGGGSYTFLVTYKKKITGNKWPFELPPKPKDETLHIPPPAAGPIDTTLKNSVLKQEWKYSVEVDNNHSIGNLDPMIIIRKASAFTTVALAVGATLLVVAAVYLIRRFLSSR